MNAIRSLPPLKRRELRMIRGKAVIIRLPRRTVKKGKVPLHRQHAKREHFTIQEVPK